MRIQCVCGQKYNAQESHAGKQIRCRKCGAAIPVPGTPQSPAAPVVATPVPAQPVVAQPVLPQPTTPQAVQPAFDQGLAEDDLNNLGNLSDMQMSVGPAYGVAPARSPAQQRQAPGRPQKKKQPKLDFSNVNMGLKLIFAGITMSLACSVCGAVFMGAGMLALGGIMLLATLIGHLLAMAGYIFCLWVPTQTGARPLIIATNICNGINVMITMMNGVVAATSVDSASMPLLDFISMLVSVATVILFLLFLKKVAEFVGDSSAAENAWSLLIFYVAVGGIGATFILSLIFVLPAIPANLRGVYLVVGVLAILITLFIWLIHFLQFISGLEFSKHGRRK